MPLFWNLPNGLQIRVIFFFNFKSLCYILGNYFFAVSHGNSLGKIRQCHRSLGHNNFKMQTPDSGDSFAHFCECQANRTYPTSQQNPKKYRYDLYSASELILNENEFWWLISRGEMERGFLGFELHLSGSKWKFISALDNRQPRMCRAHIFHSHFNSDGSS